MSVVLIFSAALFVSAFLLFLVQPMFAKMVLPLLGGTPAVWATCVVFFQAVLLAGYLYNTLQIDGPETLDVELPVDPRKFRYLDLSREPDDGDPSHSTISILRGPVT